MTDLYEANDNYSATLTAGYTVGQSTLSVTAVPTNLPTIITAGYDTDKETQFIVTGSSGGNTLTGVSRLKGANVNLDNLTPLICINNEEFQNQFLTMISSADGLASVIFGADGGSTDTYVVTLSPVPASLTTGLTIVVKFNTLNTGPATINVNSLGAKAIKKFGGGALVTGDIIANQVSILVYDGTNFQLMSHSNMLIQHDNDGIHTSALVTSLKATGAEITSGLEDAKIVTPKALSDAKLLIDSAAIISNKTLGTGTKVGLGSDAQGDIYYNAGSGVLARLPPGNSGEFLKTLGAGANPAWAALVAAGMNYDDARFKVGIISRDITAANEAVAYTGIGFTPKAVVFFATLNAGVNQRSQGVDDGTTPFSAITLGASDGYSTTESIYIDTGASKGQKAHITTLGADGFTLTWTKSGSPGSGTIYVIYIALR